MRTGMICKICHEYRTHCARGLCTSCYPKVRLQGNLSDFPAIRDAWKDTARKAGELYQSGNTSAEIGKVIGRSDTTVRNILQKSGIDLRRRGYARKVALNEKSFDKIDNEFVAYWLGFIYADGFVGQRKLNVHLGVIDQAHIGKLIDFLESKAKTRYDNRRKVCAEFNCAYMAKRLNDIGIVVGRNHFIDTLSALPEDLNRHFVRGYIDGDGSLKYSSGKPSVKIIGQPDIISWMDRYFTLALGTRLHHMRKTKSEKVFEITYNGIWQALSISRLAYKNSSVYLDRKFEIYCSWEKQYGDPTSESTRHGCYPYLQ